MKVLCVDPNDESRDALRRSLSALGHAVRGFATVAEGARALEAGDFEPSLLIAALDAADGDAGDLLSSARARDPRLLTLALVDRSSLDSAVDAIARGAHDFLWRPLSELRLAQVIASAAVRREREADAEATRIRLARAELRDALPGRSSRWISALASLERAAEAPGSVLLTGEPGTEKDDAALALHRLSPRGAGRFAFISEGESLDLATLQTENGTLFLENIEATSAGFQEQLLAHMRGPWRARFVVSIDEDPREAMEGRRLLPALEESLQGAGNTVHLPPLRERAGDVPLLARRFLEDLNPALTLTPEAADALAAHEWPGNTHELREVVRRAARLSESTIGPTVVRSVLGRQFARSRVRRQKAPVVRIAVGDSLADVERRLISKTLEFARGNKKKTAELLKLSLKTIYNKIKEYGLEH
ncbi:MAG TPA: helix-turn-helix domain-containing protein [Thermoanaerobaculia bacterium]|jgi:DNA-binding NtrC family response regulator